MSANSDRCAAATDCECAPALILSVLKILFISAANISSWPPDHLSTFLLAPNLKVMTH